MSGSPGTAAEGEDFFGRQWAVSLRTELESLLHSPAEGAGRFPELEARARRAIGAGRDADEAGDVAARFLEDLVDQGGRTGVREPLARLLALDDHALDAAVSNRIHQLLVEGRPRWNLYRGVLAGVRAALSERVAPPPALPTRIQEAGEAGRLDGKRIAEAVAWLLAQDQAPAASDREITRQLMEIYFPAEVPLETWTERPRSSDPQDRARREHDGRVIARVLQHNLDPSLLGIVMRRYRGDTLEEIASDKRLGVATVHARLQQALEQIRMIGGSERTMIRALDGLAGLLDGSEE